MQRYESYKHSDIDWLGEIPEHWKVESFKHILTERTKKNEPILSTERLSLSIDKGVTLYSDKTTNLDRFKDDFTQYKLAYQGDLVFNSMNMIVGAVGVSNFFGCVSPVYYTYYSTNNNSTKFYEYLFRSRLLQGVLYSLGQGLIAIDRGDGKYNTLRLKVSREDLRSMKLPNPNIAEQNLIVAFLDEKCAKIDELVTIKEQQIEKLKELRQVKIHQAVTKGLDTSIELKDSGIDWIGEIPKHWEVTNFKRILIGIKDGTHGTHQRVSNGNLLLSAKNIHNNGIRISGDESMIPDKDFIEITKNGYPKKNDLLITCVGTIGRTYVYDLDYPIAFQRSVAFLRFNSIKGIPNYFKFYIESPYYQFILSQLTKTSAQGGVYMGDILKSTIILPPLSEQEEIVSYLDQETTKIEQAIAQRQEQIEKLKGYKQSLINEVVTGKVKVC